MSELAFPTDATGLEIAAVNRADCNTEFMVTEPQERGAAETHRTVIVTLRHALKILNLFGVAAACPPANLSIELTGALLFAPESS